MVLRVIQKLDPVTIRQARWHSVPVSVISLPFLLAACAKGVSTNAVVPASTGMPAANPPDNIDHQISVLFANQAQAQNAPLYQATASFDDADETVTWQIETNESDVFSINNAGQISINADIADSKLEAGTKTYYATAIAQSGDQTEEIVLAFTLIIDDLTIDDITSAQIIRGSRGEDNLYNITSQTDFIIGNEDSDGIYLPANSTSSQTVIYRINSGNENWLGPDGGDSIENFEIGTDQLVLIDQNDTGLQDFSEFVPLISDASSIWELLFLASSNAYTALLIIFKPGRDSTLTLYFDEPIAFNDNDKGTEIYALHDNGASGLKRSDYGTALEVLFDDGSLLVTTDQTPYGLELV